jgi:SAM-dependent methyltransferase
VHFKPYVRPTDTVLDFGCGTGDILKGLDCSKRLGVEVNPGVQDAARNNGLEVYERTADVPDESVDVVISNHALEHTLHPLQEIEDLRAKLRPGGKIVIIVPNESVFKGYRPGSPNHHLYTWSPMCLGNLLSEAGFEVVESKALLYRHPYKMPRWIALRIGHRLFMMFSRIYGQLNPTLSQVRAIGIKPA